MADKRPAIVPRSLAEFREAMKYFAEEMKGDIEMVEREQMRLMLRDAMTFSPPMPKGGGRGLSIAAQKAGNNKLNNDVRRIFIPQDKPGKGKPVFLRQIINAVKGNDTQTYFQLHQNVTKSKIEGLSPIMQAIMNDTNWQRSQAKAKNYLSKANIFASKRVSGVTGDFRAIHDQAKGAVNGRWPKGTRYNGQQYFATSDAALAAYIIGRQQKVGWVKAGYADALAKIPMPERKPGVPINYGAYDAAWVDVNKSGFGTFDMVKTNDSCRMVAGNNIGNINNVATDSDVKNIVYGNRYQNIMAAVEIRKQKTIERANKRGK